MLYLDLDGVVADFFNAALRWHGGMPLKPVWPRGEYGMSKPLGITEAEFVGPLRDPEFWSDVRPYPGAPDFVAGLRKHTPITIATVLMVPDPRGGCAEAKREWCQYWLGVGPRDVAVFQHWRQKVDRALTCHNKVVDDHYETCDTIRCHGGQALLVPRPWNSMDPSLDFDTVDYSQLLRVLP